jgi:hypothetical protein
MRCFSPPGNVAEGGHGGGASPIMAAAVPAPLGAGGGRKRSGGPERLSRPAGLLSRLGRKLGKISFQNKSWTFKFIKSLENCTRGFRRNFDVGIFPKFF